MIDTDEIEQIRFRVEQFRKALEKCPKNVLPIQFECFPAGACGDSSLLLAKYLENCGLGAFDYVCGELRKNGDFQSHAWLQKEDLIIDITADQFDDISEVVLITKDNSWHKKFKIENKHPADY